MELIRIESTYSLCMTSRSGQLLSQFSDHEVSALPTVLQLSRTRLSQISSSGARTKHEQLHDYLLGEIQDGQLKPGTLLPSELTIAESLGVARHTVRQAMASLEQNGFVQRIHGKGTYIQKSTGDVSKTQSTGLYALIAPETQHGFYPHLIKSFGAAAEGVHHQVIICDTANQVDRQGNAILQLIDRQVAGVAIIPTTNPIAPLFHIRQLHQHQIPVVFCSRRVEGAQAPLIEIPFEQIGQVAAAALLQAGHRDIALFFAHPSESSPRYETGFRQTVQRHLLTDPIRLQVFCGEHFSPEITGSDETVDRFLTQTVYEAKHPATAIFTGLDSVAEIIYLKLIQAGYRIPADISLISFGACRRLTAIQKQLTAVIIDEDRMGQNAVEYLEKMRRKELPLSSNEVTSANVMLSPGTSLSTINRNT